MEYYGIPRMKMKIIVSLQWSDTTVPSRACLYCICARVIQILCLWIHFEIHMDNQALSFILRHCITNWFMHWILAIEEYSFTIKYCKAADNKITHILNWYSLLRRNKRKNISTQQTISNFWFFGISNYIAYTDCQSGDYTMIA